MSTENIQGPDQHPFHLECVLNDLSELFTLISVMIDRDDSNTPVRIPLSAIIKLHGTLFKSFIKAYTG